MPNCFVFKVLTFDLIDWGLIFDKGYGTGILAVSLTVVGSLVGWRFLLVDKLIPPSVSTMPGMPQSDNKKC